VACESFIFGSRADRFQAQISADRICPFSSLVTTYLVITDNVAPRASWKPGVIVPGLLAVLRFFTSGET
jgi:hypothetical protein